MPTATPGSTMRSLDHQENGMLRRPFEYERILDPAIRTTPEHELRLSSNRTLMLLIQESLVVR